MGNHLSSVFGGAEKPSDTEANSSQNVEAYSSQNAEAYSSQNAEAWPQAIECALEQPNSTDPRLRNLTRTEERLDIKVGTGEGSKRWIVHKALICNYSEYFEKSCRNGFIEATTRQYDLKEDDPVAFALFVEWLYLHSRDKTATVVLSQIDTKVWQAYAERAWVIADKLMAPLFRDYAFAKVVQNSDRMGSTRITYINDNADESSSIRIFVGELVRWRNLKFSLRYNAKALASQPGGGVDPRRYPIRHWSEHCGQSGNLDCTHRTRAAENSETERPLSFGVWYRKHEALGVSYAVLFAFLFVVFVFSVASIDSATSDTPLFNFALFMACFAFITLGITSIYIDIAGKGPVIAVGILNIIFFFSTGCAAAVALGSWDTTDTTYWLYVVLTFFIWLCFALIVQWMGVALGVWTFSTHKWRSRLGRSERPRMGVV